MAINCSITNFDSFSSHTILAKLNSYNFETQICRLTNFGYFIKLSIVAAQREKVDISSFVKMIQYITWPHEIHVENEYIVIAF